MREWIEVYIKEIDKIDEFYQETFNTYAEQFMNMQSKFLMKLQKQKDEL